MTEKGNHCSYTTHYHVVFPVKYRKALLNEGVMKELKEISKGIEERYFLEIEQMGTDGDHIHLLLSFHPKYSIGSVVRLYKSVTAKLLFKKFPQLRKELWGGEFWSDGYYVATVGEKGNWAVVEAYVKSQGNTTHEPLNLQLW